MTVLEAQSTRAADRTQLAQLDAEIHILQLAIDALYAERKLVQDRLDSYIYPVSTLPNEIVSEIFIHYLPPYPACPPLLGDGSPTKLAQICRRWRNIAHSTPHLWRAIELFEAPYRHPGLQMSLARDWLRRSRSLPLSLLLNAPPKHHNGLSLLLEHRARWEHVLLELDSQRLGPNNSPGPAPMPLLRELSIEHDDSLDLVFGTGPLDAPRLRAVFLTLSDDSYGFLLQSLSLPWGQLTRLFLGQISIAVAARILQETHSLVDLQLYIEIADEPVTTRTPVLYLLALETLILQTSDISEVFSDFLHQLRLPSLRRFHIDDDLPGYFTTDRATEVIASFTCKLQRLQIVDFSSDPEQYRSAFPDIQHVEVIASRTSTQALLPPEIWGYWSLWLYSSVYG
ncbi:hypothetical protein C8F01DRAFT_1247128 [Mycena amicta]|nr:hypothetical protein C8F01DRAFT_1247128 [Mycena amicta]